MPFSPKAETSILIDHHHPVHLQHEPRIVAKNCFKSRAVFLHSNRSLGSRPAPPIERPVERSIVRPQNRIRNTHVICQVELSFSKQCPCFSISSQTRSGLKTQRH